MPIRLLSGASEFGSTCALFYFIHSKTMVKDQMAQEKTQKEKKFCTECGASILRKAEICPKCGVRQHLELEPLRKKEKLTASLLAIFLGIFGAHKFYLGQEIFGVLYLLFCWTFIPAIIGLIEGLNYLSMKDADFDRRYNNKKAV